MTDQLRLQISHNGDESSLVLSSAQSSLVARGRRDAALLVHDIADWELDLLPLWQLRERAEAGDSHAQNELGDRYRQGRSVPRDPVEAATWYRKAAEQRNLYAFCSLGEMYQTGEGVTRDDSEGLHCFRAATDENLLRENWEEADMVLDMWQKASELGDAKAELFYGSYCVARAKSFDEDSRGRYLEEAVSWFRKAAEQNQVDAQYSLGRMYFTGEGVPRHYEEALRWFRKAADQSNLEAQFFLGVVYYQGQVVPQDYLQAARWYREAASQGHMGAFVNLGNMYSAGQGVTQDYSEALRLYRVAADHGFAGAGINIGLMFLYGNGVSQNYTEAARWFGKAALLGDVNALSHLARTLQYQGRFADAYIWLSFAVDNLTGDDQKAAIRDRDDLTSNMTRQELTEARQRPHAAGRCNSLDEFQNLVKRYLADQG